MRITLDTTAISEVVYNDVLDNTDLVYTVFPTEIKEKIILNSENSASKYIFSLFAENLIAKLQEDNSIFLIDTQTNSQIFTITAPYMYDANNNFCFDFDVTIEHHDGKYLISYLPNQEWLLQPDRIYPVVIDPTVQTNRTSSQIIDNYVREGQTSAFSNSDPKVYIGNIDGNRCYAYIKHNNLPSIQPQNIITNAWEILTLSPGTKTVHPINVYSVSSSWSSSTITWNNKPSLRTTPIATNLTFSRASSDENFQCSINVLELMAYTYSVNFSPSPLSPYYHGLMIQYSDNSIDDYNSICSGDHNSSSLRPYIAITYIARQSANIDDGYYYIDSTWKPNTNSGTQRLKRTSASSLNVDIPETGNQLQTWYIQKNSDGHTYQIYQKNRTTNYYLTSSTSNFNIGATISVSSTYAGYANQRWCIVQNSTTMYIAPAYYYLPVMGVCTDSSSSQYEKLTLQSCSGYAEAITWVLKPTKTIYYSDNSNVNSSYDRDGAAEYALQYANYLNASYDTPGYLLTGNNNCANFVSTCLHEGGGLPFVGNPSWIQSNRESPQNWFYYTFAGEYASSYTWGGADNFARFWGHDHTGVGEQNAYCTIAYENIYTAFYDLEYILSFATKGDVIQFYTPSQDRISHTAIFYSEKVDDLIYAQHSSSSPSGNSLTSYLSSNLSSDKRIYIHIIAA